MMKCLWLKALGKHTLVSIYNWWVGIKLFIFRNGDVIVQFGWLSVFHTPRKVK